MGKTALAPKGPLLFPLLESTQARTVEIDKEGDLIVLITEKRDEVAAFRVSWDAVRLASPVIAVLIASNAATYAGYNSPQGSPFKRALHRLVPRDIDDIAFELFACIVHHKMPYQKPPPIAHIIALAILTPKLSRQDAFRSWVTNHLPEILPPALLFTANNILQRSDGPISCPSFQLVNAPLIA